MSKKVSYPAADRNKSHILEVIKKHVDLTKSASVIEVASGTGQHIVYFAEHLPNFTFQPSESDRGLINTIKAYIDDAPTKNIKPPVHIDIATDCKTWNVEQKYDYMININMIHISPYDCTEGLFQNAPKVLKHNGLLMMYGPFAYDGVITPQSNIDFDNMLRGQDSRWGLRDIKVLEKLGELNGLKLLKMYDVPTNNKCLIWQNISIAA